MQTYDINKHGGVFLTTLKPGSFFGEIALLDIRGGHKRTASVFASDFTELQVLPKDVFNELCKQVSCQAFVNVSHTVLILIYS